MEHMVLIRSHLYIYKSRCILKVAENIFTYVKLIGKLWCFNSAKKMFYKSRSKKYMQEKKNRNESTSNPCTIYLTDRLQSVGWHVILQGIANSLSSPNSLAVHKSV